MQMKTCLQVLALVWNWQGNSPLSYNKYQDIQASVREMDPLNLKRDCQMGK